ncbi:aldo/keto reductase (plasmid) [Curtobacterium sp. MCLR17_007]|uniref:aldo/keto reductase n=1 Tax=Curtobacterium sp. MCLR17_007 TaxID=2175648 RepID=UPI000DA7E15B|nr:aldo/keto reductase [Curtobacterium sp. MCLR17_007]WIB62146.1 aldo/keto reductase [Curtobacterium sp. MCLR17_007]
MEAALPTRRLRTGTELTEIGLGGAQLGNLLRAMPDENATALVRVAHEHGVRYFDTAPHYGLGLSERRLGAALTATEADGGADVPGSDPADRDLPGAGVPAVVSTKVGRLLVPSPTTAHRRDSEGFDVAATAERAWDFSRDGILRSVEDSLERSGRTRFDILYLHDPDEHWAAASTTGIGALVELRDQGVVSTVGVGMNQAAMLTRFVERTDVDVVMVAGRLTLLDQSALALLEAARRNDVGVVAAGVFNSGLLGNDQVRVSGTYDYRTAPADVVARAHAVAEVCHAHGVSLPAVALQYPLRHDAVRSVVVGADGPEQALENLRRREVPVPEDLWAELDAAGLVPDPAGPSQGAPTTSPRGAGAP